MNVVDSSAWLEFFNGGPNAGHFGPVIADSARLLVPSLVVYEVFKLVLRGKGEKSALRVAAALRQGRVLVLDEALALTAAKLAVEHRLATADSLIYATAHVHGATLWTQDDDFKSLPGVRYFPKI